jgi:dTDP-4-amino-4,6-dideoxygalactose transaminase
MKVPLIDLKAQYSLIKTEIHEAIDRVLSTQKFILDREVQSLEKAIAELTKSTFAMSCGSGTDALLLSLLALNVQPGDEIITSAYSFFATAGMISWVGAKPVFVDIDPNTFQMRTDQVSAKINSRTKAIIAVHLFGQCCKIEDLMNLELPIIEDAAQAIGSIRNGKVAGSTGTTGCFSFFPTKNLGAYGDGGLITTQNADLAQKIRMLRTHGQEFQSYSHSMIGTNSRLDEIQAAILRVKMNHLEKWNQQRVQNAAFYNSRLSHLPLSLPKIDPGNTSNFHQYVIRFEERDSLRSFLSAQGIGTAVYYPIVLPLQPCFHHLGYKEGDFPDAELCADTSLALPIYPELTTEQLDYVVHEISRFFE